MVADCGTIPGIFSLKMLSYPHMQTSIIKWVVWHFTIWYIKNFLHWCYYFLELVYDIRPKNKLRLVGGGREREGDFWIPLSVLQHTVSRRLLAKANWNWLITQPNHRTGERSGAGDEWRDVDRIDWATWRCCNWWSDRATDSTSHDRVTSVPQLSSGVAIALLCDCDVMLSMAVEQQENIQFALSIRQHPCLYDHTCKMYSNRFETDKAWQLVSEQFQISGNNGSSLGCVLFRPRYRVI